uniref:MsrB domain-containing protein n=1 Tax=Oreochromis aureus TaxID=47969 RepID=A0AAZ1XGK2_OREAU
MSYCSFSGGEEYKNHFQPGIYVCSECGHELFSSMSKFEHSSPWPAFSQTIRDDSVSKHPEAWGPIKKMLMDRKVSSERQEFSLLLMCSQQMKYSG